MILSIAPLVVAFAITDPALPSKTQDATNAPTLRLEINRPAELVEAFIGSSVRSYWMRRPLLRRRVEGGPLGLSVDSEESLELLALFPSRIQLNVEGGSRPFLRAWSTFSAMARLLRNEEGGDQERYDALLRACAPAMRAKFVEMMTSVDRVGAVLAAEFDDPETASRATEVLAEQMRRLGGEELNGEWRLSLGVFGYLRDAFVSEGPEEVRAGLLTASDETEELWNRETCVTLRRVDGRIELLLGAGETVAWNNGPSTEDFLCVDWDLGGRLVEDVTEALAAASDTTNPTSSGSDLEDFGSKVGRQDVSRGSLRTRFRDEGYLELEVRLPRPARSIAVQDLDLVSLIPPGTSAWIVTGSRSLADVVEDGFAGGNESLAGFERKTGEGRPPELKAFFGGVASCLRDAKDAFGPGTLMLLGTELSSTGFQPEASPYAMLVGRVRSEEEGQEFIEALLRVFRSTLGGAVTKSSGWSFYMASPDSALPGLPVVGRVEGERVFLSTSSSAVLASLLRPEYAAAFGNVEVDRDAVAAFETTGVRAGDFLATSLRFFARRVPLPSFPVPGDERWSLFDLADAIQVFMRGVGRVEARTELEGAWACTTCRVHSRPEGSGDVVERYREINGISSWPEGQMLVARGEAKAAGEAQELEAVFTRDGECWLALRGEDGETIYSSRTGNPSSGRSTVPSVSTDATRAWGMAVVGAWSLSESSCVVDLVDEGATELTLRLARDGWLKQPYVVLDRDSLRCVGMGYEWRGRESGLLGLGSTFSDFRPVGGVSLPHRCMSISLSATYSIDSWEFVPLDLSRMATPDELQMRYDTDAGAVEVAQEDDWFALDGTIDGEPARIAIAPFANAMSRVIDPSIDSSRFSWATLRVGPLSGGPLRFESIPVEAAPAEDVDAVVGVNVLAGACVRLDVREQRLELLPPGSFTGDDFRALRIVQGHLAFEAGLPGGTSTWASPALGITARSRLAVPSFEYRRLEEMLGNEDCPLRNGRIPFLDLAGYQIKAIGLSVDPPVSSRDDPTPFVFSMRALHRRVLELDFPNARYRLVKRR